MIGLSFGAMHSARRGTGSDVAGSRPYLPGDDIDTIDWAASARLSLARDSDDFIVRERHAEEAPRVVIVCDRRPAMSFFSPLQPWLSKPDALHHATRLITDSAIAARAFVGYLDHATWQPPRSQRRPSVEENPPFDAPDDNVASALTELARHPRDVPAGTFVFVLSDFLVAPDRRTWLTALARRWDVVPVVTQDPVWERSFPDVTGVAVPLANPNTGRVGYIRLGRGEVAERREANERRWSELLRGLRALDLEPVIVSSHDRPGVLTAFLSWADRRRVSRGRKR